MVHGRAAADVAADTARKTFEEGALAETLPTVTVPRAHIAAGIKVQAAFVAVGLAKSNGEVNRAIGNSAIAVNDKRVTTNDHMLGAQDITAEGVIKLSLGKKRHVLLRPE
jgi:tyrosyl-tRNA synthetase